MNKEEKYKELLEKIKQIPDDAIEGAIDSLYTEYIKEAKEYIEHEIKNNKLINGYTDIYIFQTEVELLLKYIQHLKQKETILDKVTDKLKEVDKKYKNEYENIENMELSATKICVLQELSCVIEDIEEILNIIEGEKK